MSEQGMASMAPSDSNYIDSYGHKFHIYITGRAFTISDKEHLQTEFNHLKLALQKNGHNKKDITKIINKHASKTTVSDI